MTAADRHRRLVEELVSSGALSSTWRTAFLAVPRHVFIPEVVWVDSEHGFRPLTRAKDPAAWLDLAYANEPIVTQVDDGRPAAEGLGRRVSSSASQPSVVAEMLEALDVEPGMSVLEIGTGTGYNAALLAHRLGDDKVTSIEIDPEVGAHARDRLAGAGSRVRAIVGDGSNGRPDGAPYDRVIATASVHDVPYAWVEQTRPGGIIVTPWATDYHNGALLRLVVGDDGTARGGFIGNTAFMRLRAQRIPPIAVDEGDTGGEIGVTRTHPYEVAGDFDASFAIGLEVPGCQTLVVSDEPGYTVWFVDPDSRSRASVLHESGADEYKVVQAGPRRLWDEVESAYRAWIESGRPAYTEYGLTVGPHGQAVVVPRRG